MHLYVFSVAKFMLRLWLEIYPLSTENLKTAINHLCDFTARYFNVVDTVFQCFPVRAFLIK